MKLLVVASATSIRLQVVQQMEYPKTRHMVSLKNLFIFHNISIKILPINFVNIDICQSDKYYIN